MASGVIKSRCACGFAAKAPASVRDTTAVWDAPVIRVPMGFLEIDEGSAERFRNGFLHEQIALCPGVG